MAATFGGGLFGTAIRSWIERRNSRDTNTTAREANGSADWKAFVTEQRENFKVAVKQWNRQVSTRESQLAEVERQLEHEQTLLKVALSHLRDLRSWVSARGDSEIPSLPNQLDGRL
ncbi:hypothetical protein ACLXNF_23745 [Mycobacteroides chelonae]